MNASSGVTTEVASVLGVAISIIVLPGDLWMLFAGVCFLHFSWSAGWGEVDWSSAFSSSLSQSWEVKFQILIFHFLSFCCPSHRTGAVDRASFAPSVRIS